MISARVINNSSIRAELGGKLLVETAVNDNDWDGANDFALLYALGGNLELRDNVAFPFGGAVWAQAGREVFANGFALQFKPGSRLTLDGGTYRSTHATDIGGTVTVSAGADSILVNHVSQQFETGSTLRRRVGGHDVSDRSRLTGSKTVVSNLARLSARSRGRASFASSVSPAPRKGILMPFR